MKPPSEFDQFAEQYDEHLFFSESLAGESHDYFVRYKVRDAYRAFHKRCRIPEKPVDILDFGCGIGSSVPFWHEIWPQLNLTCADISERSLEIAEQRYPGLARFVAYDGHKLPFSDHQFDLVFAACVFHHVPPDSRHSLCTELQRVLKPGRAILIYEHNPLNLLTQIVVRRCPLDANAVLLYPSELRRLLSSSGSRHVSTTHRVFFPRALQWLRGLESRLTWLPFGAQYYVMGWSQTDESGSFIKLHQP